MNEEQRKVWDGLIAGIYDQPIIYIYRPSKAAIIAVDAELTRLRAIVARVDALEAFLDGDESRSIGELAGKLHNYLMGEG